MDQVLQHRSFLSEQFFIELLNIVLNITHEGLSTRVTQLETKQENTMATVNELVTANQALQAAIDAVKVDAKEDYDFIVSEIARLQAIIDTQPTPAQLDEVLAGTTAATASIAGFDLDPTR